jgi:hypothetical protein
MHKDVNAVYAQRRLCREVCRPRTYGLETSSIAAAALALLMWLSGCAVDEPREYSCAILYSCGEGQPVSVARSVECAADITEATDTATERGIAAATAACPDAWQYVYPHCQERQEPCER